MKAKLQAKVKGGSLVYMSPERYENALLGLEGKNVEVSIGMRRNSRSAQQNRYYWGVVVETLAKEVGYSREEMHERLLMSFGLRGEFPDGTAYVVRSTAYNTTQFEEYLQRIRQHYDQHGVVIPLPNEVEIPDVYFSA